MPVRNCRRRFNGSSKMPSSRAYCMYFQLCPDNSDLCFDNLKKRGNESAIVSSIEVGPSWLWLIIYSFTLRKLLSAWTLTCRTSHCSRIHYPRWSMQCAIRRRNFHHYACTWALTETNFRCLVSGFLTTVNDEKWPSKHFLYINS